MPSILFYYGCYRTFLTSIYMLISLASENTFIVVYMLYILHLKYTVLCFFEGSTSVREIKHSSKSLIKIFKLMMRFWMMLYKSLDLQLFICEYLRMFSSFKMLLLSLYLFFLSACVSYFRIYIVEWCLIYIMTLDFVTMDCRMWF